MQSMDTKQWRIFKSYNTLYHIKNVNNRKEMKEKENEHRRIWINNIDQCLAKRSLRTKIRWLRGRRWRRWNEHLKPEETMLTIQRSEKRRWRKKERKKEKWNTLHSERRAGIFLVICKLDFLMPLTLLAEWNKSSFVHSLVNMVKADGAKLHDYKRIGK